MAALLTVENLSVRLPGGPGPGATAVTEVDFMIGDGEVVGIAGESGCGKTLTALSLLALLPRGATASGSALFDGQNLLRLKPSDMRRVRGKEISFVFQDPASSLHPMLTVGQQLVEHMRVHLKLERSAARARAEELLGRVRIPEPAVALRSYPHQFSGGMRQRIAIAMALACMPRLMIADEPTTALDVTVQAEILRLLDSLCREENLSVLLITHDLGVISTIATRLYVFYAGRVVESGPAAELLVSPHHPYTRALLAARPDPDKPAKLLLPIEGAPPQPQAIPPGCAFHPRCPSAQPACRTDRPLLLSVAPGRQSRCPIMPPPRAGPAVTGDQG